VLLVDVVDEVGERGVLDAERCAVPGQRWIRGIKPIQNLWPCEAVGACRVRVVFAP
jgi:hypothetical protein